MTDPDWKKQYVEAIKRGMVPATAAKAFASKTMEQVQKEMVLDPDFRRKVEALDKSGSHHVSLPALPDTTDIRELASAVEADIFHTYFELMTSPDTPPAVKKASADALADRARGKPAGESAPVAPAVAFNNYELARRIAYVLAKAVHNGEKLPMPFIEAEVVEEIDNDGQNKGIGEAGDGAVKPDTTNVE